MKKTFVCPFCQMKIMQEEMAAGRSTQCPKCNRFFQLKLSDDENAVTTDSVSSSNSDSSSNSASDFSSGSDFNSHSEAASVFSPFDSSGSSSPFGNFSEMAPAVSNSGTEQKSDQEYVANPLMKREGNYESSPVESPVFVRDGVVVNPLHKKKNKEDLEDISVSLEVDENGNVENPMAKIRAARRQKESNRKKSNIEVDEMIAPLLEEQQKENNRLEAAHNRKAPKDRTPAGPIETENNPLVAGIEIVRPVPAPIKSEKISEDGETYDFKGNDPEDLVDLERKVTASKDSSRPRNHQAKGIALLFSSKSFVHPQRNKLLQLQGDCKNRFWIFIIVLALLCFVKMILNVVPEEQMSEVYKLVSKGQLTRYLYYFSNSIVALTGLFFLLKYVVLLKKLLGLEGMLVALVLSLIPIFNLVIIYKVFKRSGEAGISRYSS